MPTLAEVEREACSCIRCPLAGGRTNVVFGVGDPHADLMLVGEGPGRDEDLAGVPFVGRSGKLLDKLLLQEMGLDRRSCYIANVVKCRPPGNRDPRPAEMAACRGYLDAQFDLIQPRVVVTLGNVATRAVMGTNDTIGHLRGLTYPFRHGSRGHGCLVPTYHPAAVLRGGGEAMAQMRADLVRAKEELVRPGNVAGEATGGAAGEAAGPPAVAGQVHR